MKKQYLLVPAMILGFTFSAASLASGTVSRPASMPKMQESSSSDSNERGRIAYMNKLACSSCPMPGGVNDMEGARGLIAKIDSGEFQLSNGDKRRIKNYLKNRFGF